MYADSASSCLAAVWHRHSWRLGLIRSHTRRAVCDVRWRKMRRRSARAAAVWSRGEPAEVDDMDTDMEAVAVLDVLAVLAVAAKFTATGANLGTGSATDLDSGAVQVHLVYLVV